MASLAQDPTVLKVAELLEVGQRLDKEHAELTKEVARHRSEREATRQAFQEELVAAQEAEEVAVTRRNEAMAEAEAIVEARRLELSQGDAESLPHSLERLREELKLERERVEDLLCERTQEAEDLQLQLKQAEEQLRLATEASRAEVARRAPIDSDAVADGDVLADKRAHVEHLLKVSQELRSTKVAAESQVEKLRAESDKAQRAAEEANSARRDRESDLQQQVHEMQAETQRLSTQLANAREHAQELRSQLRTRIWGAYEGRIGRNEAREQGVQTRYAAEDAQLKEKVVKLSAELEEMKQRRSETTPWYSLCLRGSGGRSIGGTAAVGAGAALMRALGQAPNHPMAQLTPRGLTPRSQTPRSMTPRSQTPRTNASGQRRLSAASSHPHAASQPQLPRSSAG